MHPDTITLSHVISKYFIEENYPDEAKFFDIFWKVLEEDIFSKWDENKLETWKLDLDTSGGRSPGLGSGNAETVEFLFACSAISAAIGFILREKVTTPDQIEGIIDQRFKEVGAPKRGLEELKKYVVKLILGDESKPNIQDIANIDSNIDQSSTVLASPPSPDADIADDSFHDIIGKSEVMQELHQKIREFAKTEFPILITGERGSGKELVAKAIHRLSNRTHSHCMTVNCATIAEALAESVLFGHEKGAFTGATERRKGIFEEANRGTIFLDEIHRLGIAIQPKLLRVLETGTFQRIGSSHYLEVDVRVICATNKNLEDEIKEGRFIDDLYDRINVLSLQVPPLRKRRSDIPLLVQYFLEKYSIKKISPRALDILKDYDYPGNIRELQNILKRIVPHIRSIDRDYIIEEDLDAKITQVDISIFRGLSETQRLAYEELISGKRESINNDQYRELSQLTNNPIKRSNQNTAARELKGMVERGIFRKEGEGPATKYFIVKEF